MVADQPTTCARCGESIVGVAHYAEFRMPEDVHERCATGETFMVPIDRYVCRACGERRTRRRIAMHQGRFKKMLREEAAAR